MLIAILIDNLDSWFQPYGSILRDRLIEMGNEVYLCHSSKAITQGDICFILSCSKKVKTDDLKKNKHNIVVHASDLPNGRGFSPIQHIIRLGNDNIMLTLFEAEDSIDAGPYYFKSELKFKGNELLDEIRDIIGKHIIELCVDYVRNVDNCLAQEQKGAPTYFPRLTQADDELNVNKTLYELMSQLRASDFERYCPYFYYRGRKFYLTVKSSES